MKPGDTLRLAKIETEREAGLSRKQVAEQLEELAGQLAELQELLYAARQHSFLIIPQGMDTSGKDGTIKHVMSGVNPQGCRVEAFKIPTEQELAHDFLWRVHQVTPARGMMTIFNRSHYEDVVAARVHRLVPASIWERRYDHINDFERMLADHRAIILKFFLHISRKEQAERLLASEQDPKKAWKLAAAGPARYGHLHRRPDHPLQRIHDPPRPRRPGGARGHTRSPAHARGRQHSGLAPGAGCRCSRSRAAGSSRRRGTRRVGQRGTRSHGGCGGCGQLVSRPE